MFTFCYGQHAFIALGQWVCCAIVSLEQAHNKWLALPCKPQNRTKPIYFAARQYFGDPIDCISRDDIPPNLLGKFDVRTLCPSTK